MNGLASGLQIRLCRFDSGPGLPLAARGLRPLLLLALLACGAPSTGTVVTFPGSALGAEGELLQRQVERFTAVYPEIRVELRRTPDAADQRHQLYVQWLNARAPDPDVLQLDVIWTAEFAAAAWIRRLEAPAPDLADFFAAPLAAARWRNHLYAMPWFVDVGMLYWRTDLLEAPPRDFAELERAARAARVRGDVTWGLVLPAARYEGLVTVFLEFLTGFGGGILDDSGRVVVDRPPAVRALATLRDAIRGSGIVPADALGWQEEQTRFAFQNGRALFMRNWPYAWALLQDPERSAVAGRVGVAPMPAGEAGRAAGALGGQLLAVNAASDVPEAAQRLVEFLTRPEQMLERARVLGQHPPRRSLYTDAALQGALGISAARARELLERAVPRPATPLYTELSEALQVHLHRALSGQEEPAAALAAAAGEMRRLLARAGLGDGA